MFLTMGLVLAICSCFMEVKLVHGSALIRKLYTHGVTVFGKKIEPIWFNTAGSLLLSLLLGMIFAANGLVIMFGGIISTGLSQMWFIAEAFCQDHNINRKRIEGSVTAAGEGLTKFRDSSAQLYRDFKQPIIDIKNFILVVVRIITFPIVMARKASIAYTAYKQRAVV